jgi:hypothetical protein
MRARASTKGMLVELRLRFWCRKCEQHNLTCGRRLSVSVPCRDQRAPSEVRRHCGPLMLLRGVRDCVLGVADELCAERLIEHEYLAKTDLPGPQILKAQIEDARGSIRNLKLKIEDVVETSDMVGRGARQPVSTRAQANRWPLM